VARDARAAGGGGGQGGRGVAGRRRAPIRLAAAAEKRVERDRYGRPVHCAVLADSDAPHEVCAVAERLGELLAELGAVLVTGGRGGAMEAACRGAARAGGVAVGVLPSASAADANPFCSVVLATGLGHARNAVVAQSGDFAVALGASAGTISEVCFAWMAGKTVLVLNAPGPVLARRLGREPPDARGTGEVVRCRGERELRARVEAECRRVAAGRRRLTR
jgi:uncharacterized protein (TIGR00725 family)